jgi:hypothetical protein
VKGRKTSLSLECLGLAAAVAVLSAPMVQARAGSAMTGLSAEGRAASVTVGSHNLARTQLHPKQNSASHFWADAGILAGVLAGIVVLGLWGDVAIGGVIFGVAALGAGALLTARKAARARKAFRREAAADTSISDAPTAGTQPYLYDST